VGSAGWPGEGARDLSDRPDEPAAENGVEDFQIVRDDTLRSPAFFDGARLARFECVIANPPFSLTKMG
jgi:hypothetical protein